MSGLHPHAPAPSQDRAPLVVGIGGTVRAGSSTEAALRVALRQTEELGAETVCFGGEFLLSLPMFSPQAAKTAAMEQMLESVLNADGVIIATPGYHGSVSGLVKNALDYIDKLSNSEPDEARGAVGCIVTGTGSSSLGTTLVALRSIVHELNGWPTPHGATINTSQPIFGPDGACTDESAAHQLEVVGAQVMGFIAAHRASSGQTAPPR